MSKLTPESIAAMKQAMASVRSNLVAAPIFMVAVAAAAGMAPTDAKAWSNDYENLGRVIGGELGRGNGYGPQARVGQLVGEMIGKGIASPMDAQARETEETGRLQREARARAVQDAAYDQQRRAMDPSYRGSASVSDRANATYGSISSNMDQISQRQQDLAARFQVRQR